MSAKVPLALLLATLVCGLASLADALTCPEDGCASVQCDASVTRESCTYGLFERRGSACGCCDICRPISDLNEVCEDPANVPEGLRPFVICRDPLVCKGGVCKMP